MNNGKIRLVFENVQLGGQFMGFPEIVGIKKSYVFAGGKFDSVVSC